MVVFPSSLPRSVAVGLVVVLAAGSGCDLPGLRPVGPTDAETGVDADTGGCSFGRARCLGRGRVVCNDDGEPEFRSCGEGEICRAGRCRPLTQTCESELPFQVSRSALRFDSNGDLRPTTASVRLGNCSAERIELSEVSFDGPAVPHSRPVFAVDNRVSVEGRSIPPGESLRLKVRYQPTFGFFLRGGDPTVRLEIRADRPYTTGLRLRRRIDCVSATPRLDFGTLEAGRGAARDAVFANCGNQPSRVELGEVFPIFGDGYRIRRGDDVPKVVELAPGETKTVPVVFTALRGAGVVWRDVTVPTVRGGPSKSARPGRVELEVIARRRSAGCVDRTVPRAAYRLERPTLEEDPADDPYTVGRRVEIGPHRPIWLRRRLRSPDATGGDSTAPRRELSYRLVDRPNSSRASLERIPGTDLYRRFEPDAVGSYVFRVDARTRSGRATCPEAANRFRVKVRPEAELYVELAWSSVSDPIPGDRGYGTGADLNLHLLRTDMPPLDAEGWQTRQRDCWQRGSQGGARCSNGVDVRAASVSSGAVEAMEVESVDGARYCIAVQSWNPYRFPNSRARLRVYHRGSRLDETPITRQIGDEIGTVWFAGCWDGESNEFTVVDAVKKSF